MNLIQHGAQRVAVHTRNLIERTGGAYCLVARPTGKIRVFPHKKLPEHEVPNVVGTYNRKSPVGLIIEHCADWLNNTPASHTGAGSD